MLTTLSALLLVYFLLLLALSRWQTAAVPSRAVQLLRAFFPSWKFFDDIGDVPLLYLRTGTGAALDDWQPALPRPRRRPTALILNADGNFLLACSSLLQQLLAELQDSDPDRIADSVPYALVRDLVRFRLADRPPGTRYQFKLHTITPDGDGDDILISPLYEPVSATLAWTARLVALAVALQTVEQLQLGRRADSIWRWQTLRRDWDALPLARPIAALLRPRPFGALLWLRLATALVLGIIALPPHAAALVLPATLLATTVLIQLRWRGTFNGGSDFMTLVLLSALTVAAASPSRPSLPLAALLWIAVQTATSYFLAGIAKLKSPAWRSGRALPYFLATSIYDAAPRLRPLHARLLAWATLALECTFPLALLDPRLCLAYLSVAFVFHLANAWLFGLNRFVFAWAAAYPAVYFCSRLIAR